MILDSKNIKYEVIDITEPGRESDKDFMQNNAKSSGGTVSDPNPRSPLPPQMFNDEEYCGDYDQFDLANEVDTLEQFLKLEAPPEEPPQETEKESTLNGDLDGEIAEETSQETETTAEKAENDEADTIETSEKVKETSPVKENSPIKEIEETTKEATPVPVDNEVQEDVAKQGSPEKEASPDLQNLVGDEAKEKSPVKETDDEPKEISKESSPEKEGPVNENGTVSSREQSEGKDVEVTEAIDKTIDNPSDLLIESEQAASAE